MWPRGLREAGLGLFIALGVMLGLGYGAPGAFRDLETASLDLRFRLRGTLASGPAVAGASGPCKEWEGKICAGTGDESAICQQAKSAADLLTTPVCENALSAVPATLVCRLLGLKLMYWGSVSGGGKPKISDPDAVPCVAA